MLKTWSPIIASMVSETVLILCATGGFTVAILAIVVCVGCMYCKYVKWVKYPAIHPAPPTAAAPVNNNNETPEKHTDVAHTNTNQVNQRQYQGENDETSTKQTFLETSNGQIIKPNLCINQDILTFYRSSCLQNASALIAPPSKVPQLYREESMQDFEKEEKRLLKKLSKVKRANVENRKSRITSCSGALKEKSSSMIVMPFGKLSSNGALKEKSSSTTVMPIGKLSSNSTSLSADSSDSLDLPSSFCKCGRTASMVTILSDTEEHFVKPTDVDLGDF